ncbi:hypothetical protein EDD22DRAFT_952247 [Suillus occidentalis]|nr:hypothetical protein EDD22DRAFT_952247 [Suillus occidentalis]
MDLSFPTYLYDNYTSNQDDLKEGLFKGKILIQGYKAVFMSPSSAKDVEGDGDGMDIIQNNRHAKKSLNRSIDGDFDYAQFWYTIIDFFEWPLSQDAWCRVDKLLEWWTRKIFRQSQCNEISNIAKASMSIDALARQRAQRADVAFDSS